MNIKVLHNMVRGMDLGKTPCDVFVFACVGCVNGKEVRQPFPTDGGIRATRVFQLVHSDVCGSFRTKSSGGAMYFLTFFDGFSKKIWMYMLKSKDEVLQRFK